MSDIKSIKNKMLIGVVALGALAMPVATGVASVSGLTYQNSTDVSFTFNPTLTVSVSDDFPVIPAFVSGFEPLSAAVPRLSGSDC